MAPICFRMPSSSEDPPPLDHLAVDETADLHAADLDGLPGGLVAVEVSLVRAGERIREGDAVPVGDELLYLDLHVGERGAEFGEEGLVSLGTHVLARSRVVIMAVRGDDFGEGVEPATVDEFSEFLGRLDAALAGHGAP